MNAIKDKKIADKMFELAKSWEEQTEVQWCFNNWSWSQLEKEKKHFQRQLKGAKKDTPNLTRCITEQKKKLRVLKMNDQESLTYKNLSVLFLLLAFI